MKQRVPRASAIRAWSPSVHQRPESRELPRGASRCRRFGAQNHVARARQNDGCPGEPRRREFGGGRLCRATGGQSAPRRGCHAGRHSDRPIEWRWTAAPAARRLGLSQAALERPVLLLDVLPPLTRLASRGVGCGAARLASGCVGRGAAPLRAANRSAARNILADLLTCLSLTTEIHALGV